MAIEANLIERVHIYGQGQGSATFLGNVSDIFVRLFSSGGVDILSKGRRKGVWRKESSKGSKNDHFHIEICLVMS